MSDYQIPVFVVPAIARVLDHITENPGCTSRQIASALKMTSHAVGCDTGRLRAAGLIRRPETDGERRMCWEVGEDLNRDIDKPYAPSKSASVPSQRTVSKWDSHIPRDPLITALFGKPR